MDALPLLLLLMAHTTLCQRVPPSYYFFPFDLDDKSHEDCLQVPLHSHSYHVYQSKQLQMFVSFNGLISFGQCLSGVPKSLSDNNGVNSTVIAPLWTLFNEGSLFYRTTSENSVLNRVADMIMPSNPDLARAQLQSVIILTWDMMSIRSIRDRSFTFQVVLTAFVNGTTFAIFVYHAPDTISNIDNYQKRVIGFSAGDGTRFSNLFLNSPPEIINVFRIDGMNVSTVLYKDELFSYQENITFIEGFIPFGLSYGDHLAMPGDDNSFGPFPLPVPFKYFSKSETNFYVSTNGVISFEHGFTLYEPHSFTNTFTAFLEPVIAPLWMDFNTRKSGSIYYRVTNNTEMLYEIAEMVTESLKSSYQPTFAVIVTWYRVPLFSAGNLSAANDIRFTFQAVLSTNGKASFAALLYETPQTLNNSELHHRTVGFNSGREKRSLNLDPESLVDANVFRIDGSCITGVMPDDNCGLSSEAHTCKDDSRHKALTCNCDIDDQSQKCLDLFPFGEEPGDNILPRSVAKSASMDVNISVFFFQKEERKIHLSVNGILSFQSSFTSFRVIEFPSTLVPVIAPLWADFNFRDSGDIYYRVTQDEKTLRKFTDLISDENPIFRDYHPKECVIVTWSFANLSSQELGETIHTFQVVLATDGKASFAALLYENTSAIESVTSGVQAIVGFDAGDQGRSATVLSGNTHDHTLKTINIYRIDGNCITSVSAGDVCGLNSTALECEKGSFRALSCLCDPGFMGNNTCQEELFHFGIREGDVIGPREDDMSSSIIHLNDPIVFYRTEQRDLYISTNGIISFQKQFNSFVPMEFPRNVPPYLPLIAPLWADFNFRHSGTIFYRVEDKNVMILEELSLRIATENSNFAEYAPTSALIATWYRSELFRRDLTITFQAVVSTDQNVSLVEFRYRDMSILDSIDFAAVVGFDAGDSRRSETFFEDRAFRELYTQNHTGNLVFRIDGNCVVPVRNDRCGLNSVPIRCEEVGGEYTSTACLCNTGVKSNDSESCLEYLQFGDKAGDMSIPSLLLPSRTNRRITLPISIFFYERSELTLHVLINGAMLFDVSASTRNFLVNDINSLVLIAPLWIRGLANPLRNSVLYYRVAMDPTTLAEVEAMIVDFNPDLTDFHPKLAFVSTWLFKNDDLNTSCQSILATDGSISFAIFLYEHPNEIANISRPIITFSTRDSRSDKILFDGVLHQNLQRKNVFRIDGACITSASPGNVCGLNSVAAECISFNASRCKCNPGYQSEDGLICENIDECKQRRPCDENATCMDLPGSFHCKCNEGFNGNGFTRNDLQCIDIDECDSSPCDENANCTNMIGTFQCKCNHGYEGDGITCRDINECVDNSSNCNRDAICSNTNGSFECRCKEGFDGDGYYCTGSTTGPTSPVGTMKRLGATSGGIAAAALALLLVVVIVIIIIVHKSRSKKIRVLPQTLLGNEDERIYDGMNLRVKSIHGHNLPKSLIIPSCNLELGKILGQGEFGVVYKGFIKNPLNKVISDRVAVKTLRGFVQEELVADLLRECAKMSEFDHPNILTLKGVCLDGGPAPFIIMPFMANGCLLSYLKKERESLVIDPSSSTSDTGSIARRLLDICLQVAKGMEYLASKRVIHRDLAARNCMIDANFMIKVADFGLSESIDVCKDYFRQDQDSAVKLPIKWLALESINDGVFSEKSDVWSYGVTCWEIFSGGKVPYPGIHPVDLPRQLEDGYRLKKPLNLACGDKIYSIIMKCWKEEADSRPTFAELVTHLSSHLTAIANYIDFTAGSATESS